VRIASPCASFVRNKLRALEYNQLDTFSLSDEKEIQKLVVWLEDVKIRFYKIEERGSLRNYNENWIKELYKYLQNLKCPRKYSEQLNQKEKLIVLDWLLNHAISLQYKDNSAQYNSNAEFLRKQSGSSKLEDETIYDSPEFKAEIESLSKTLQIPQHSDHRVVLKTILEIVEKKFSEEKIKEALQNKDKTKTSNELSPEIFPLGFDTGDPQVNECATVLRLLYIEDQKVLQTKINELLVEIQNYTANPKTDTSLGKIGK